MKIDFTKIKSEKIKFKAVYPKWILKIFKEYNYYPENPYEANWFLKDAVFEVGKQPLFKVNYITTNSKSVKEIKEITITEKNCLDIFFTPIWENADLKTKINCIYWSFEKIAKMFNVTNYKLFLTNIIDDNNDFLGFTISAEKIISLNIFPSDTSLNFLMTLVHELTHAKQNNLMDPFVNSNKVIDFNAFYCAIILNSSSDVANSYKHNYYLYENNPVEIGAENKAINFLNQINRYFEQKFEYSAEHNAEFFITNLMNGKFKIDSKTNVKEKDQLNKLKLVYENLINSIYKSCCRKDELKDNAKKIIIYYNQTKKEQNNFSKLKKLKELQQLNVNNIIEMNKLKEKIKQEQNSTFKIKKCIIKILKHKKLNDKLKETEKYCLEQF